MRKGIQEEIKDDLMIKKTVIMLIISALITLLGCSIVPEPPEPEPNEPAYRALLVGVGDYLYFGSIVDLDSPVPNTERLEEIFSQCKFGEEETEFLIIERLVDLEATKENILNGILDIFADADDNDISYFYYMGHGGTRGNIPVITPTDAKFTLETDITVHELEEHLSMINGTKVVFIESCHSGNFIDKNKNDFNDMVIDIFAQNSKDLINKESYQVLTSCKGNQVCWEHKDYSYFCMGLYEGCQELNADINEDEIIDLSELHKYIKEWVWNNTNKDQAVQMYPDNSTFPIVEY